MKTSALSTLLVAISMTAHAQAPTAGVAAPPVGSIERLDPALDALVDADAKVEYLGEGFIWSEGPVWVPQASCLLFSDVPANTVYRYKDGEGVTPFLKPSGYTDTKRPGGRLPSGGVDE